WKVRRGSAPPVELVVQAETNHVDVHLVPVVSDEATAKHWRNSGAVVHSSAEAIVQVFGPHHPVRGNHPLVPGADGPPGACVGKRRRAESIAGVELNPFPGAATGDVDHAGTPGIPEAATQACQPSRRGTRREGRAGCWLNDALEAPL